MKKIPLTIIISLSTTLIGCGGEGGSDTSMAPDMPPIVSPENPEVPPMPPVFPDVDDNGNIDWTPIVPPGFDPSLDGAPNFGQDVIPDNSAPDLDSGDLMPDFGQGTVPERPYPVNPLPDPNKPGHVPDNGNNGDPSLDLNSGGLMPEFGNDTNMDQSSPDLDSGDLMPNFGQEIIPDNSAPDLGMGDLDNGFGQGTVSGNDLNVFAEMVGIDQATAEIACTTDKDIQCGYLLGEPFIKVINPGVSYFFLNKGMYLASGGSLSVNVANRTVIGNVYSNSGEAGYVGMLELTEEYSAPYFWAKMYKNYPTLIVDTSIKINFSECIKPIGPEGPIGPAGPKLGGMCYNSYIVYEYTHYNQETIEGIKQILNASSQQWAF
ncbi:TPA: hypothetical protein ACX6RC_001388 [Photobacterium damselae]